MPLLDFLNHGVSVWLQLGWFIFITTIQSEVITSTGHLHWFDLVLQMKHIGRWSAPLGDIIPLEGGVWSSLIRWVVLGLGAGKRRKKAHGSRKEKKDSTWELGAGRRRKTARPSLTLEKVLYCPGGCSFRSHTRQLPAPNKHSRCTRFLSMRVYRPIFLNLEEPFT